MPSRACLPTRIVPATPGRRGRRKELLVRTLAPAGERASRKPRKLIEVRRGNGQSSDLRAGLSRTIASSVAAVAPPVLEHHAPIRPPAGSGARAPPYRIVRGLATGMNSWDEIDR